MTVVALRIAGLQTGTLAVGGGFTAVVVGLAGRIEDVVGQLGLFYTTLVSGADRILVPNGVLIQTAVTPLREPERVEFAPASGRRPARARCSR